MNDVPKNEPAKVSQQTRELLESLGFVIYEGPVPLDELPIPEPPNAADAAWAMNDRELHRRYQGLVVAVRDKTVWGAGKDEKAAWEDARKKPGCPAQDDLAFVDIWGMPGEEEAEEGKQTP
jgi:hypothetical protein